MQDLAWLLAALVALVLFFGGVFVLLTRGEATERYDLGINGQTYDCAQTSSQTGNIKHIVCRKVDRNFPLPQRATP